MQLQTISYGQQHPKRLYLLHGWGLCSRVFDKLATSLAKDYHVILIDLPGYGINHQIPANRCDGIMECLEDTILPNSGIFGWSLGGILALKYTIMHPEQITCLITCCSSARFTSDPATNWQGTDTTLLQRFTSLLTVDNCQSVIDKFLSMQAMGSPSMRNDIRVIKGCLKEAPAPKYYELQAGLKTLMDEDLRGSVSRIHCPSLHLYGAKDRLTPVGMANYWPQKEDTLLYTFAKSSHAPFISEPNEFTQVLLSFLQAHY